MGSTAAYLLVLESTYAACTMPFYIPENQNQDYVNEAH
jgi:hypothetical protein